MRKHCTALLLVALLPTPLLAGVVFEVETTDHSTSPPNANVMHILAEEGKLKMEFAGDGSGKSEMIWHGESRTMVIVDHDSKSYFKLDEQAMKQLTSQLSAAMQQMEAALQSMPEAQRERMREMMQRQMPQQAQGSTRPPSTVRKTSERAKMAGYPCVRYDVLRGGDKVSELWVTDWDNIEGGREIAGTFEEMAEFFRSMVESLSSATPFGAMGANFGDNPYEYMKELGGLPVVTKSFEDGALDAETSLRSASRKSLGADTFEPPQGYRARSMGPQ